MSVDINKVFSENPENDLWRELLQFTYDASIERFLIKHGHRADQDLLNSISGAFLQAYEYYRSAQNANIQIAPLLLYYGSSNLLYGMVSLLEGKICNVKNHGMKILIPEQFDYIANTIVHFTNPDDGGVHVFGKAFGYCENLTNFGDWTLSDFLDSIAEISFDYSKCYDVSCGKTILLDVFNTPDGKIERVYFNDSCKADIMENLGNIAILKQSYLPITIGKDYHSQHEFFILRHKINGTDISEISYSGQPYLRAGHIKNGQCITIPNILNLYISLFVLASLCRYYPERWSPFVLKDTTGEKLLLEKFLFYARRIIPNIVLDRIIGQKTQYVSDRYASIDTIKFVGEHKVKEMIKKEVQSQIEKDHLLKNRLR